MDQDAATVRFARDVRNVVLTALQSSSSNFAQLLSRAMNCDPLVLRTQLHSLVADGLISVEEGEGAAPTFRIARTDTLPRSFRECHPRRLAPTAPRGADLDALIDCLLACLPEPSPVYYQWWFSHSAYRSLAAFVHWQVTVGRKRAAFLGASTLAALCASTFGMRVAAFDIDDVLLGDLAAFCRPADLLVRYDVADELDREFTGTFDFVFVDPPWSSRLLPTCLARAASLLCKGGVVAISLPQLLTRPGMLEERSRFLETADALGLDLQRAMPDATEYAVPVFEREAYAQAGLCLEEPWRKGDLYLFSKASTGLPYTSPASAGTHSWDQFRIGSRRLFLRRDGRDECGRPAIHAFEELGGFIYPTTSSRSAVWQTASLVNTRNCIARAAGRTELASAFRRICAPIGRGMGTPVPEGCLGPAQALLGIGQTAPQRGPNHVRCDE
jgi:hypothetical protein